MDAQTFTMQHKGYAVCSNDKKGCVALKNNPSIINLQQPYKFGSLSTPKSDWKCTFINQGIAKKLSKSFKVNGTQSHFPDFLENANAFFKIKFKLWIIFRIQQLQCISKAYLCI